MKLGNFHVKWHHDVEKGFTYVQVIGEDHPLPRSESFAAKSPKDVYNKAVGRVVSLVRALTKLGEDGKPLFTWEEIDDIGRHYYIQFGDPNPRLPQNILDIFQKKNDELTGFVNKLSSNQKRAVVVHN